MSVRGTRQTVTEMPTVSTTMEVTVVTAGLASLEMAIIVQVGK